MALTNNKRASDAAIAGTSAPGACARGSSGKMSFFQNVHTTKVSTQIHSSISQYDVYKVSSKKIDHNLTVGCLND